MLLLSLYQGLSSPNQNLFIQIYVIYAKRLQQARRTNYMPNFLCLGLLPLGLPSLGFFSWHQKVDKKILFIDTKIQAFIEDK